MAALTRNYGAGESLFKEGENSQSMFLIKTGVVSARKARGAGFIEVGRVYANEVIGELSFFDRQPRSASAFAVTDVEALEIDFVSLDKVYEQVPEYMKSIMTCVADRLRKANESIRRLHKHTTFEDEAPPKAKPGKKKADEGLEAKEILATTHGVDLSSFTKKKDEE